MNAEPKPVKLSEWFQQAPGRAVTRAQLLNVFAMLIERRIQVERIIQHEAKLHMRFLIWLFPGLSKLPRHVQDQAAEAALDPEAAAEAEDEGEEEAEPDPAIETTDLGSKVIDRRSAR